MTDDNLRGLPLPIPIYFPAIPLIVTVCVTLCKDDILLTTYHIDDMMTYCWLSTCISCSRSSSRWPQWRQDQTQAPQACTHWIRSLVNLGIFLFLISHLSFSLFLTFHLVRAIVLPAIPDVVAYKFSGTKVLSVSMSDYWNPFSLWPKFHPLNKNQDCNI